MVHQDFDSDWIYLQKSLNSGEVIGGGAYEIDEPLILSWASGNLHDITLVWKGSGTPNLYDVFHFPGGWNKSTIHDHLRDIQVEYAQALDSHGQPITKWLV